MAPFAAENGHDGQRIALDAAVGIQDHHRQRQIFHECPQVSVLFSRGILRFAAHSDVLRDNQDCFAAGEAIYTEISARFRPQGITAELAAAGLRVVQMWTDRGGAFALTLAVPADLNSGSA